jgi:hypothetical protein
MSLAVLADHMASKGRGPDSMLIHMSPREVQGLQALAENNGGSLTINPETGLPEAGFLDKLLPAIIGVGISYISGGAIDPKTAGMIVGGIETARTGDIGKGIQAGLGAYGGATLGSGFTTTGTEAIGSGAAADAYAGLGAAGITDAQAIAQGFGSAEELMQTKAALASQEAAAAATPFDKLSAGASKAADNPMKYLKANAMPLLYAAGPAILAGANVKSNMPQTVTKPGMITPYSYFGGQYVAGAPYQASPTRAAGGGLMGMDDGGYNPGQLDFTQRSEPVVRMAGGGVPGYANGALVNDQQIFDYFKTPGLSDTQIAADMQKFRVSPADIARATGTQSQQANYEQRFAAAAPPTPDYGAIVNKAYENIGRTGIGSDAKNIDQGGYDFWTNALKTGAVTEADLNKQFTSSVNKRLTETPDDKYSDYVQNFAVNKFALPTSTAKDFTTGTQNLGVSNAALADALEESGYSKAAQYALTHAQDDKDFTSGIIDSKTGKPIELYNTIGYKAGDLPGDEGGLKGYYANINYVAKGLQGLIDSGKMSVADAQNAALAELERAEGNLKDVKAATGKDFGDLFKAKAIVKKPFTCPDGYTLNAEGTACIKDAVTNIVDDKKDCPTGYHYDPATKSCVKNVDATQNTTTTVTTPTNIATADKTAIPVGVSGAGITTINPNGTVTTRPDLSLGMSTVRDAYEDGGGSLGVNKNIFVPKTYKELEDRFKLTGGSKQAMDYLTGKTKYSPVPYTEDGQISKSYAESVMKIPRASSSKMYIFKDGKFVPNPEYAIPTYDSKGVKSTNLTNADVKTFMDKAPAADAFYTWATTNNLSPEQIALASGRPINEISKLFTGAKDLVGDDGKIDQTKVDEKTAADEKTNFDADAYLKANPDVQAELDAGKANFGTKDDLAAAAWEHYQRYGKAGGRKYTKKAAGGGLMNMAMARGGMAQQFNLGDYSDGGRLLRGPGDGISDSIPATIGGKRPARLADGEFVVPARIVSELGNGSTEAGARKLYAMMDRVQKARRGTVGKGRVAKNSRSEKYLPA